MEYDYLHHHGVYHQSRLAREMAFMRWQAAAMVGNAELCEKHAEDYAEAQTKMDHAERNMWQWQSGQAVDEIKLEIH